MSLRLSEMFSAEYSPKKRTIFYILFAIFAIAVLLRISRAIIAPNIEKDGVGYVWMAESFAENGWDRAFELNPRIPPLYILLIGTGIKLGLSAEGSGLLISILCGSLMIIPAFFIGRILFRSFSAALVCALLIAVHPNFVRISSEVLRDPLFLLCSSSAIWMLAEGIKNSKWGYYAFGGAFSAFAIATRSEGIEIIAALCAFIFLELFLAFYRRCEIRKNAYLIFFNSLAFFISLAVFISFFEILSAMSSSCEWHAFDTRIFIYLKSLFYR